MVPSQDQFDAIALKYPKPRKTSGAGAKRLFSNRDAREPEEEDENTPVTIEDDDEDEVTPTIKRYRSAEWPLSNSQTPQDAPRSRTPLRNRSAQSPLSNSNLLSPSNRSSKSKFMEGSMNDRVSFKPPAPYLEDGELLSEYDAGVGGRDSVMSSRADSNRNSIYRFGRSIASSFNPNNWKIWSKEKVEEEEDEETAHARSLIESKEKAERIYRELKESGRFRDAANVSQTAYQPTQFPDKGASANASPKAYQPSKPAYHKSAMKHDSGIEFNDKESCSRHSRDTSVEDKRKGRVYLENPILHQTAREYSPVASEFTGSIGRSNSMSPFKQSFLKRGSLSNLGAHFKKPSLSNIKKSFMAESREDLAYSPNLHQARRMPSRKDLQKQQKLVKRVSNLEGKLEAARRELSDALNQPMPALQRPNVGRRAFVPGTLSSLPSERLLTDYVDPEDADDADGDDSSFETHLKEIRVASQAEKTAPNASTPRKGSIEEPDKNREIIIRSIEIVPEIEDSQEVYTTNVSTIMEVTEVIDIAPHDQTSQELGNHSDNEVTPKAAKLSQPITPPKKRKSAFSGLADDGGIYKPSNDEEESDDFDEADLEEPVIKKLQLKPKTPSGLARPSKHQKTTPATTDAKTRSSPPKSRIRAKGSDIQGSLRRGSVQTGTTSTAPQPGRKLSKIQPATEKDVQSANSPPSTPTFMGMKYEQQGPVPGVAKTGTRVVTPTASRNNSQNAVYSADPGMKDGVPPMPAMPKNLRFVYETPSTPKAQVFAGNSKMIRTPSPKKPVLVSPEKEKKEDVPFEWPEDIF